VCPECVFVQTSTYCAHTSANHKHSIPANTHLPANTTLDWCCFYYFVRNSLVAMLEDLCARNVITRPWLPYPSMLGAVKSTGELQKFSLRYKYTLWRAHVSAARNKSTFDIVLCMYVHTRVHVYTCIWLKICIKICTDVISSSSLIIIICIKICMDVISSSSLITINDWSRRDSYDVIISEKNRY